MKWETVKQVCPEETAGQMKSVTRFAFLPVALDNGFTVWLESYRAIYRKEWVSDEWGYQIGTEWVLIGKD